MFEIVCTSLKTFLFKIVASDNNFNFNTSNSKYLDEVSELNFLYNNLTIIYILEGSQIGSQTKNLN